MPRPQEDAAGKPKAARRRNILAIAAVTAVLAVGGVSAALVASSHKPPPAHPASFAPTSKALASPTRTTKASAAAVPLTQFKVCTTPAITCTNSYGAAEMKTKPTQIVTSADGSGYVKDLTWSGWSTATAHGIGTLEVDDCTPNCAQGTYTGYPATITLSGLTSYGNGKHAYSVIVISAPNAPYPQEAFTTGLVP